MHALHCFGSGGFRSQVSQAFLSRVGGFHSPQQPWLLGQNLTLPYRLNNLLGLHS